MKKPLIYVTCANPTEPITLNVLENTGMDPEKDITHRFKSYELEPYRALTIATSLLQFYQWKVKEGIHNDTTNGNVCTKDRMDTTE
jgi:hypothetical protein